jgi:mannose-6-phosphate isomerase-like protein (cupin superfamily)
MAGYQLIRDRTRVPVPGGKLIEEMVGRAHSGEDRFSLAHMVAPPGWAEPPQTPDFGELTLVVRGRVLVEVEGERVEVAAGEVIWTEAGTTVRYSNPFGEESEYYAFCLPAFSPELAHRHEDGREG